MACVLCSSVHNPTDSDVIPKWLLRAFDVQEGSTTVSVAEEATADDPFDETGHRLFIYACAAAGERAKALEAYAQLSARLADELGIDPAPDTQELYLAILRQQHSGELAWSDTKTGKKGPVRWISPAWRSTRGPGSCRFTSRLTPSASP